MITEMFVLCQEFVILNFFSFQLVKSKKFQMYDYGSSENMKKYNQVRVTVQKQSPKDVLRNFAKFT